MPLSILVRLSGGRYDAGGERPSQGEWPPHPARVFCALAASAEHDADWAALQWLEQQGPAEVWADPVEQVHRSRARVYVVQNAVEHSGGGNLTWPGRSNGWRTRASAVPQHDSFAIVWPEADPSADTLSRLNRLAWRVPYVGRSTSTAEVTVIHAFPAQMPGALVYAAVDFGRRGPSWDLRVPYAGYTEALRSAYADGRRSWEVARARPYTALRVGQQDGVPGSAQVAAGPFGDLLVWSIQRPAVPVGGEFVVSLTSALRRAVLSVVPDPVPGQVCGHTEPGRPHVAFLAIPDVGHQHADGHVLGLAVAIPGDIRGADRTVALRALLLGDGLTKIRYSGGEPMQIRYGADRAGLQPERWTTRRDECDWVTATPVMLDGHTRRGRDEAAEVARSLVIAGYPEPATVEVSAAPMLSGAIWRPRFRTLPPGRPRRQMVHARIRFPQPVTGPVLAGSMRYLGLGLFLPVSRRPAREPADRSAVRQIPPARRQSRDPAEVLT